MDTPELNYSTTEKECLAVLYAVHHFRPYIYGKKFTLVSDHEPLRWIDTIKDTGQRLIRWRLKLRDYDYEFQHKSGKLNTNADALSRNVYSDDKEISKNDTQPIRILMNKKLDKMTQLVLQTPPIQGEVIEENKFPKGNISRIEFPKKELEEIAIEYDFTKPTYVIEKVTGPPNCRRYTVKCTLKDLNNGNTFVTLAENERKIRDAKHTAAYKILKQLDDTYYFCEEESSSLNVKTYVMCLEQPTILKLKLYKWTKSCESCYERGHIKSNCNRPIRNKRLIPKTGTETENSDEFLEIPGKPIDEPKKRYNDNDSWD
ncbi:uncharacterized protein LOC127290372 [Leptopilina boulardi]|uniref:uncharacterized protein LOC127278175 n=1 Tax=Leptopilina boulardi TaxID=63433 RepID=UPI0021F548A5|nr:uncharacterized protein LOC127278175 [Leptopilina boulardi]XP_051162418.1 uncharacterized protein LOC127282289 [Leptopilina boulardi]XP_051174834.1 uncharacterized protein LOC127290372 [Leptopilina boulardi]